MTLAPYYVPWALSASALFLLGLSLCWMVFHDGTGRVMAALRLSDGIAFWLLIAAVYHTVARWTAHPLADIRDSAGLWFPWAWIILYAGVRITPSPLRREDVLLALALAGWAGCIGAGFPYLDGLEARADTLAQRPDSILSADAPDLSPLTGALALNSLEEETRTRVADLLRDIKAGAEVTDARRSATRQLLFPELLEHYRRDMSLLRSYQGLQIILICAVLLVWGFGRKHSD